MKLKIIQRKEAIFANNIYDQGLIQKIYKINKIRKYIRTSQQNKLIFLRMDTMPEQTSLRQLHKWPRGVRKSAQCHFLSGKCKLKPQ